ncbi:MAG: ATPase, T2SS/T4P/T4SS family [Deltaproteobacteria bacterium]|nr:ATPase, T2SS/T4P/T4SS family [Deltaproteobacteria bacterium]
MFKLKIIGQGVEKIQELNKTSIFIGRAQENDLILAVPSVSKRHARMLIKDGRYVIMDVGSTNGTFVNGKQINGPVVVKPNDIISIGEYEIVLLPPTHKASSDDIKQRTPPPPPPIPPAQKNTKIPSASMPQKPPSKAPNEEIISAFKREVHSRLIEAMDLKRLDLSKLGESELYERTREKIREIVELLQREGQFPSGADKSQIIQEIVDEALGLGPLEEFIADKTVTEIMVNGAKQIYIERDGKLYLTDKTFSSDQAVMGAIERIIAPLGRRIDESSPLVDARLKDGSRVNAIIPPLAIKGPTITIRKFRKDKLTMDDLIRSNTISEEMVEFLKVCVFYRKNILISGGTGSGKTTTLNALSEFIPNDERIITVEDAAELQLKQEHWVQLESRPPNIEGKGQITIRDLVRNCLRMRPDRIIVGECRGGEALDMLQAMNTGHDGSLTTIHANSPRDALSRLETMVLMAGIDIPVRAIREQVSSAINIILHQARFSDGSRKVTHISEITGMEGDIITMQDIFVFKQQGYDENGRVLGEFVATGFIPKFYDELRQRGIELDLSIFK